MLVLSKRNIDLPGPDGASVRLRRGAAPPPGVNPRARARGRTSCRKFIPPYPAR